MRNLNSSLSFLAVAALFSFSAAAKPLLILTNDSMLGKGSFGEALTAGFKKQCPQCEIELVAATRFSMSSRATRRDRQVDRRVA